MFNNIGEKLKTIAKYSVWIGMVAYIALGVFVGFEKDGILGIIIAIVGVNFSWLVSFLLYGFGQFIEKIEVIADDMDIFLEFRLTDEEKEKIK